MSAKETIRTRIWREEPEQDNPFAAAACYCHGYDVYGEVLGNATWIEFLFLLFRGERPNSEESFVLENLAIGLANPGPRDYSVLAAMNGGVGGSHNAACLMAALAVGAGQLGGGHEVAAAMKIWQECGTDLDSWKKELTDPQFSERADVWKDMDHPPGFDPYGESCPTPVRQILDLLSSQNSASRLIWLRDNRKSIEGISGHPLAMTGVAAAALSDLGFDQDQGEMLFIFLRLPGAAAHAIEQKKLGFRNFPFFLNSVHLQNDPAQGKKR